MFKKNTALVSATDTVSIKVPSRRLAMIFSPFSLRKNTPYMRHRKAVIRTTLPLREKATTFVISIGNKAVGRSIVWQPGTGLRPIFIQEERCFL